MDFCELFSQINNIKLLAIESEPAKREIFHKMLSERCFSNFEFVTTTSEAWEIVEKDVMIDLIIICSSIPAKTKLDFCKKLRTMPYYNEVRIMLDTKIDELVEILPASELLAVDLLCEPVNRHNVLAWVKQLAENRKLFKEMRSYREKMQAELEQARQMQNLLLPKTDSIFQIEQKYGIKVSSYFETCDITGGDFWGVEPLSRHNIGFYIIDCTGHGVTAAFNTFRLHAVMKDIDDIEIKLNPDLYLSYLNKKMHELFSPGQFATMFYGVMDTKNNILTYSAAASTPPFVIRDNCALIDKLKCDGYLIGIQKNAAYEVHEINFAKGDKILLYSDALIENINLKGEMYGEERLLNSAKRSPECKDGVNLLAKVMDDFSNYRQGPLADDLTINIYARMH